MLTGFPKGLEFSGYYEHCLSFVGERVDACRSGLGPQWGWWDGLGGGGRGGQKAPAQQRRKVGEQETFLCIFLLPAGLKREGTESIPCDFLFKEGRHAKANFGINPPNRSSHTSLTLNLRFLVLGVHPKAVE